MSKSKISIFVTILLGAALAGPSLAGSHAGHSLPLRFLGAPGFHQQLRQPTIKRKLPLGRHAGASDLVVYDEPDAAGDTLGYANNAGGFAVGEFVGGDHHTHGFLRAPDNTFTLVNVSTFPTSAFWLNDKGAIIGNYLEDGIQHAYIRTANGRYLTFEPEDTQGAYGLHINNKGVATGDYVDSAGLWHGFVRGKDGTLTTFEEPHAATGPDQGTYAGATNVDGDTTGPYVDENYVMHGYVRHKDSTYTEFDVAGAVDTIPFMINVRGWVAGLSDDKNGVTHGFIRKSNGRIIIVDVKDAGTSPGQGTVVQDVNRDGVAVGLYVDANDVPHGFLRYRGGEIKEFDAPGAGPGGTTPFSINSAGEISGYMNEQNDAGHGMIGTP